jgi:hypothetical protein
MSKLRPKRRRSIGRLNLTTEYGDDDPVLYVELKLDGERFTPIAKRYPGQNWISLEPGWTVIGSEPGAKYGGIEIYYDGGRAAANPH